LCRSGGVLSQESDGVRQPITYASRILSAQEPKASSTYELECLAVLFGTKKFRKYIEHLGIVTFPASGEDWSLGSENIGFEIPGASYYRDAKYCSRHSFQDV